MLFDIRDGRAFPSVHALLMEPYKSLWEKDTTPEHAEAVKIFTYAEFLCNPRKSNVYFHGYKETDRPRVLKKKIWGDENYQSNIYTFSDIMLLLTDYKEWLDRACPGLSTLNTAKITADNLDDYLKNIDLNERTASGTAVTKPADVTKALKDIPDVVKKLKIAIKEVHDELEDATKTRNSRKIGYFER